MSERFQYEVEGPAAEAFAKVARRLERIGADDGEHVSIELIVAFDTATPVATTESGDAELSSFAIDSSGQQLEGETDGGVAVNTADTADTTDATSSSSSSSGLITEDDREVKTIEEECRYHELLTLLEEEGATSKADALTYQDMPCDKSKASPALSTLYRRRLVERDESSRPYRYWVSPYGFAYLDDHGPASSLEYTDDGGDSGE